MILLKETIYEVRVELKRNDEREMMELIPMNEGSEVKKNSNKLKN